MHGTAHGPMMKNIHKCIISKREQVRTPFDRCARNVHILKIKRTTNQQRNNKTTQAYTTYSLIRF